MNRERTAQLYRVLDTMGDSLQRDLLAALRVDDVRGWRAAIAPLQTIDAIQMALATGDVARVHTSAVGTVRLDRALFVLADQYQRGPRRRWFSPIHRLAVKLQDERFGR